MASELRINKVNSDAKKVTIATSAAFHATDLPSWKSTCELTVEGRRLFVHNATTLAQKLAPLKSTCESIQEKIPIVECSATIPALKHWKETLLLARNANTHAGRLMKKHTFRASTPAK